MIIGDFPRNSIGDATPRIWSPGWAELPEVTFWSGLYGTEGESISEPWRLFKRELTRINWKPQDFKLSDQKYCLN